MNISAKIRVIVVDDEALARTGIVNLLGADSDVEVVATSSNGREAIRSILSLTPDLVFLDVQMPDMDGFDVLRAVGAERMPHVIFATAYDQFATRAFDIHAVDYLLKPFNDERFMVALHRAKEALRNTEARGMASQLERLLATLTTKDGAGDEARVGAVSRIVVKHEGRSIIIRTDEIDWIEAADYVARIHSHGKTYQLREPMSSLETRLDPQRFFRAHRSAIVNLDKVREVQPSFHGEHVLVLADGSRTLLTRSRKARLEQLLRQRL